MQIAQNVKLWINDKEPAPIGYFWAKNIDEAKKFVVDFEEEKENIFRRMGFPAYGNLEFNGRNLHRLRF